MTRAGGQVKMSDVEFVPCEQRDANKVPDEDLAEIAGEEQAAEEQAGGTSGGPRPVVGCDRRY